jgi:FkbM family methyltransferase
MEKVKHKILQFLSTWGFERKLMVEEKLLDRTYKVRKGTIRKQPQYDEAWMFALSSKAVNIYDIGSNIGQSALVMLYHKNVKRVVLVDPNPKALAVAAENMIFNNLSPRCLFIPGFVSEKKGDEIDFYTVGDGEAGSKFRSFAKTASSLDSHYKVSSNSIDSIEEETGVSPDFIKVDVEGAEFDVLKGAVNTVKKTKCKFLVEVHSGEELSIKDNTLQILNWCNENNYTAWYLSEGVPLSLEVLKTRERYHALLLPDSEPYPEYLKRIKEEEKLSLDLIR